MRLDARFTFDRLVVGEANRLAASAARAVAEAPGTTCNPLVIYGGSGLGKTHLLTATAHLLAALQPQAEIIALSMDELSEQFQAAVAAGEAETFGHRLARADLLLLDDLQFLAGRRELQVELLRLVTVMQATGRQIVCASDRPPREIADVDARLVSRLASGLLVDVGMPEYEAHAPTPRHAVDGHHPSSEFLSFLSEVAAVVQEQVATWQVRLREAIAYWKGEGYRTAVLERALALPTEPDVQGLLATYVQAIAHLRALEAEAMAVDRALGGHALFRDPERLGEAEDLVERAMAGELPLPGPHASFTRAGFDVGASNQLAVHAADAVIAAPGTRDNPLLIVGPSGVGKTHLLHAIGNAIAATRGVPVACVQAQAFVDELISAIEQGTVDRWRARYRAAHVLIIDDVQCLAGTERAQHECSLVFSALVEEGRQIVLSSDRLPSEMPNLAAWLRSRFEGGLVVPIQSPDRPLRERVASRVLAALGRGAPSDVLDVICDPAVQSVRELIGVVNRLAAAADALGVPLDAALAREELGLSSVELVRAPDAAVASAGDPTFLDRERVVWEWPDVSGRLIDELR